MMVTGLARRLGREVRIARRARRGAILLEMAASVFVIMLFAVGLGRVAIWEMEMASQTLALRTGTDLVHRLDTESLVPSSDDIDRIGAAMARAADVPETDYFARVHVAQSDASGTHTVRWDGETGGGEARASRVAVVADRVEIGETSISLRDDERLVIVEWWRGGIGAGAATRTAYDVSFTSKFDPDQGE